MDGSQYELLRLLTSDAADSADSGSADWGSADSGSADSGGADSGSSDYSVTAIGDPDQAIYGFRGGDVGYFLRFRSDYPGAAAVQLSRGYRSAPTIIRAAMQLIEDKLRERGATRPEQRRAAFVSGTAR